MKKLLILLSILLVFSLVHSQKLQKTSNQLVLQIGQIFPGMINQQESNQKLHNLKIEKIQNKYLFIRMNTYDTAATQIGLYSNKTRQLVHACRYSIYDSCYIPSRLIKQNQMYVILIQSNQNIQYNLYTYWANIQHINPNQQLRFIFDQKNTSQLFHLELKQQKFQQIRIILKPQTNRKVGDYIRIYASLGVNQQPTVQKYDFVSTKVWGQSQAIILSKNDLKGQKNIGLYIVGSSDMVYLFQCELIQQRTHQLMINQTLQQYLPNSFVIKLAVFTGQLQVGFFYDKQFKKPYDKIPYQYMSDMQFNFQKQDFLAGTQEIYMKLKCPDSPGIYQISTQSRLKTQAFQIQQNVFQFSVLRQKKQALYFYSRVFNDQYQQQQNFKFQISTINIFGNLQFQFFACKPQSDVVRCRQINQQQNFKKSTTQIIPKSVQNIGSKKIFTIQMKKSSYQKLNIVQKQLMIIVMIKNIGDKQAAYALQYNNANQIRLLRQGRALQDQVNINQKKFYKYINNNPNVTQIRIHVNQNSGLIKFHAQRQDIFVKNPIMISPNKQYPDTIIITQNLTNPIYLQVNGYVNSIFTISVSPIHPQHRSSNAIIMAQDLEYQLKIKPFQFINVQLHPIKQQVVFQFYSQGGPIVVCEVDLQNICIGQQLAGSHGQIKIDSSRSRQINLRISNFIDGSQISPNKQSNNIPKMIVNQVKVTMLYHTPSSQHCDQKKINKVYSQNIKSGSCFKFHLPLVGQISIMSARSDLGATFQQFYLCGNKVVPNIINKRHILTQQLIKTTCSKNLSDLILQTIVSDPQKQLNQQIKMEYSVQYNNDIITLTDGVAYMTQTYSPQPQQPVRTFFYQILDQSRSTNIMLFNKLGMQKFFGYVTSKQNKFIGYVTQAMATINSKQSTYYSNPFIKLTPQMISNGNCGQTCILILTVYTKQKMGQKIDFGIQITQNHIVLKQNQIKKQFLSQGSVGYYQFQSRKQDGNLIFQISDNNRNCAKAFMSKSPFPGNSNYYTKQNSGLIIYKKYSKGTYYFSVQAIQDCPFTLTVSQGQTNITKIQQGQFYDIKLKQGQQKWFYLKHSSKKSFKISSLQKYGNINIYVNQTQINRNLLNQLNNGGISKNKFNFKSINKNTLNIDQNNKGFCSQCYYLIGVTANQNVQGSIFIGSQKSKIGLTEGKTFFDEIITKNTTTFATFYKVGEGNMQLKVHSGKIKIQMIYGTQKFQKQFKSNKKSYNQTYNFTRQAYKSKPIQIKITSLSVPAVYSLQLFPKSQSIPDRRITPGQHTYLFLSKGNNACLKGKLNSKQQQIYFSVDNQDKMSLSNIQINFSVNKDQSIDPQKQLQKQIVGNILSLKFKLNQSQKLPLQYRMCLKTVTKLQDISLFIFQQQNLNLIPEKTDVLVKKQSQFVLYPTSAVIIDLFQCKGNAQIFYGSQLARIKQQQSHKLDVIGLSSQPHAIKLSQFYTNLYLDVIAETAVVQWMPLVQKQQKGIGYFKYNVGDLDYTPSFNNIDFKIGGVIQEKQTNTTIKNVKYNLFISNSKETLQQAVMCQNFVTQKIVKVELNTNKFGTKKDYQVTINVQKKKITDVFSDNQTLYFNVAASMILNVPVQQGQEQYNQNYKFIYNSLTVPSQVFRQNKIQMQVSQVSSLKIQYLIILAMTLLSVLVITSCVFVKYVIPALGRIKNRVLVQQKQDPKDQSMPLPQSSDRNQIERGAIQQQFRD